MGKMTLFRKFYLRRYEKGFLEPFEKSTYSQNGEDGIIEEIFFRIGTDTKYGVEFGVQDGTECNSRLLKEKGWDILQMDGNKGNPKDIKREFITAENINKLFNKYKVPHNLDFLCIDIDFNDYWVWKKLDNVYKPRLVVLEYNSSIPPWQAKTVKYDSKRMWDNSNYFGGSLLAMYKISKAKGYSLVYCESRGVNAFFVRDDLVVGFDTKTTNEAYRGPSYGILQDDIWTGHKSSRESMIDI